MFKMVRQVLPPGSVAEGRRLADDVGRRTGVYKFSIAGESTSAADRVRALDIVTAFLKGPVPALFREQFGTDPALCLNLTTFRHQALDGISKPAGWHLDLGFLGDDAPFLVSWTALHDVGVDRPGLEVCVPAGAGFTLSDLLGEWKRRQAAREPLLFTTDELDDLLGASSWQCRVARASAGDAAVFDQFVMHRTQLIEGDYKERHSLEFRMMDLDRLPIFQRVQPAVFARIGDAGDLVIELAADGHRTPLSVERFAQLDVRSADGPHG